MSMFLFVYHLNVIHSQWIRKQTSHLLPLRHHSSANLPRSLRTLSVAQHHNTPVCLPWSPAAAAAHPSLGERRLRSNKMPPSCLFAPTSSKYALLPRTRLHTSPDSLAANLKPNFETNATFAPIKTPIRHGCLLKSMSIWNSVWNICWHHIKSVSKAAVSPGVGVGRRRNTKFARGASGAVSPVLFIGAGANVSAR